MTHGVDLNALYQQEQEARQNFEMDYERDNPRPQPPEKFSIKNLGVEFPVAVLTGIAAIVQAAMRTGFKFFDLATRQGMGVASWLDGASAMLGVEGFVAVVGLIMARQRGKALIARGELRLSNWEQVRLWGGLTIALIISVATGFAQSITGAQYVGQDFQKFVDWLVILALGLGASLLAWLAGEIVGTLSVRAEMLYLSGVGNFDKKLKAWLEERKAAWQDSDQYKLLHADIVGVTKQIRAGYRTGVRSPFTPPNERLNGKALKVLAYLDEHATPEFVPGATEVAAACLVSKSYASEVTKGWIAANPPEKRSTASHNGHQPALEVSGSVEAPDASG